MIEIEVIEASAVVLTSALQEFPAIIGRSPQADVSLTASGVWDQHLTIDLDRTQGFLLRTCDGALTSVNGQPCQETLLKNGDFIEIGGVKLRFWLRSAAQHGFRTRELLTWIALGLLALLQVVLMSQLPN